LVAMHVNTQVAERRAEARKEAANTNDSQVLPTTPLAGDHPAATAPAASTSAAAASPHSDGDGTAAAEVTVETRPVDSNAACFGTLPRGMLLPATVSYVLLQMVFFAVAISTTGTTSTHVNPMIGTDTAGLRALGATWTQGVREYNEWWRVLTAGVVHAGLIDLVFSGCGVVLAGSRLERRWGPSSPRRCSW
jgi:membrane associated rhomboid family serine protease